MSSLVRAQFVTSFEPGKDGSYVAGSSISGKYDSNNSTDNTWTLFSGFNNAGSISTTKAATGSSSYLLADNNAKGAYGAYLNLTPSVGSFISSTPWTFSISFNLRELFATDSSDNAAGDQTFGIGLGQSSISGSGKYWFRFVYLNGDLQLMVRSTSNGSTGVSQTAVSLGSYTDYADVGAGFITLSLSIDPTTKTYTSVSLSGAKLSKDHTAAVQAAGATIPWGNTTTGDPLANLVINSGTASALYVHFDDISLTSIPEPATNTILAGLSVFALALAYFRRR